jgi:FHA domain-containing protein
MITLTVTSFKGAPAAGHLSVSLDELGGTIGRADTNNLVLPDPERAISRTHAQVVFRAGAYALVGAGANPVIHNGNTIERGVEVRLAEGDQIDIGSYRIVVSTRQANVSSDPFEAAFATSASLKSTAAPSRPPLVEPAGTRPAVSQIAPSPAAGQFDIPDDWDPFKDDLKKGSPISPLANTGAMEGVSTGRELSRPIPSSGPGNSLDDLFGLHARGRQDDPLAGTVLAAAGGQARASGHSDAFGDLLRPAKYVAQAESDHASDLKAPWTNAPIVANAQAGIVTSPPPGAVFSWTSDPSTVKGGQKDPPPARHLDSPHEGGATVLMPKARPTERPSATSLQSEPVAHDAPVGTNEPALLQALREGLGVAELRLDHLSPETMRQIGKLLREATKGTIELLGARAALKREMRANVTMIVATENNSLKFSPSVDVALQYLLGPRMSGFMPPVESMRDAYDDLRAHQLGVMAGMKAALAGVIQRFDPANVESKVTAASGLSSLLPSTRKAKLWELFQEVYHQLAADAEEDFHAIYGVAFLRAYQEYVAQIDSQGKG